MHTPPRLASAEAAAVPASGSASGPAPVGALLREWRRRRRRSQLDLALDANVSQRHLSCVESGRAAPSREMVARLAEELAVPLRERNRLLLAAGFAPRYAERPRDDPATLRAVELVLRTHLPHPAIAVDRHWNLVAANDAVAPLLAGVREPALLAPPVNMLRLSLHPGGVAPRIANLAAWRAHVLERLRRQVAASGDPVLEALLAELLALGEADALGEAHAAGDIFVPLELDTAAGRLSLILTTTVFGTPTEVTLSELAIEAFYPADAETAARLAALAAGAGAPPGT